jgi:hypothetical protein
VLELTRSGALRSREIIDRNIVRRAKGGGMTVKDIILRVDLTPGEAAGLKRLADKTGWSEAMAVLYPHIDREVRGDQAREILGALAKVHEALENVNVSSFPWIGCGRTGAE